MIRATIIEDEERSRNVLENLISTYCPDVEVIDMADGVKTGVEALLREQPDVLLLDVQLKDGTGFDVLEQVKPLKSAIIFTTAYDQYALKAFKFSAIDYLLKPIDIDELKGAIQRVAEPDEKLMNDYKVQNLLSNLRRQPDEDPVLLVSTMETIEFIRIEDIARCEAKGAYCMLHLRDSKPLLVSKVIKEFEFLLKDFNFYRVHQSHLVNLKEIRKFIKSHSSLVMRDGTEIQLARSRKDGFFEELNKIKA